MNGVAMTYISNLLKSQRFSLFASLSGFPVVCFNLYILISLPYYAPAYEGFRIMVIVSFMLVFLSLSAILMSLLVARFSRQYFAVVLGLVNSILMFSAAYGFLYKMTGLFYTHCPTSDTTCQTMPTHDGFDMFYFSITTLTTLGVGDFIPANNFCKFFVETEAILGYAVLAFSIAALTTLMQRKD